jgi:hypothetical protein
MPPCWPRSEAPGGIVQTNEQRLARGSAIALLVVTSFFSHVFDFQARRWPRREGTRDMIRGPLPARG